MSSVLPGVDEVLANFLLLVSMLIRLDLPTFERPIKAYSGFVSLGHIDTIGAESENSACLISIRLRCYELKNALMSPKNNIRHSTMQQTDRNIARIVYTEVKTGVAVSERPANHETHKEAVAHQKREEYGQRERVSCMGREEAKVASTIAID